MAKYFGLGSDHPIEDSELRVANALRGLPDDWIVFHHVSWQSRRCGRQGDGEADFLVLHPQKGMLVIEVKGGGIDVSAGRWFTTNRHGKRESIKNPYEQAVSSKHALVGWLREHGFDSRVRLGHAVVFPHMQAVPSVGPSAPPEISLAKPDLAVISAAILRCFEHWELTANMSPDEITKLLALLAPTVFVLPNLAGASSDAESQILEFTAEQIEAFAGLRATRGGLILGGAGTGKTVLAVARAQQLARDGFRTLLVCYNELLGRELALRAHKPPHTTVGTFHTFCLSEARRADLKVPDYKSPDWWEKTAPNLLIDACAQNESIYDAIVIDEGQDFSPLWLDSLRCLLSNQSDAPFFIFADPLQDIWRRDWSHGMDQSFVWHLTRNLRNTQPIAVTIAAVMSIECQNKGVPGPEPHWHRSENAPGEKEVLIEVERLLGEGFDPCNLVVLCGSSSLVTKLRERTVCAHSFGRWGGRGIVVETVSRFKGLEAQAIILALSSMTTVEDRTEAYVGMSRARSVLVVIGREADYRFLNWPVATL